VRLQRAGLVDRFRVGVFPVITGSSGRDRIYDGYPDVALELVASRTFDGRLQLLEYVPTVLAGPPGTATAGAGAPLGAIGAAGVGVAVAGLASLAPRWSRGRARYRRRLPAPPRRAARAAPPAWRRPVLPWAPAPRGAAPAARTGASGAPSHAG
jgi:RibD C-terminal domain